MGLSNLFGVFFLPSSLTSRISKILLALESAVSFKTKNFTSTKWRYQENSAQDLKSYCLWRGNKFKFFIELQVLNGSNFHLVQSSITYRHWHHLHEQTWNLSLRFFLGKIKKMVIFDKFHVWAWICFIFHKI